MTTGIVIQTDKSTICKVHFKKISVSVDLPALTEIFSKQKFPSILGGNPSKTETDRFSYWAAYPREIFEFKAGQKEPFIKLKQVLDKYKLEEAYKKELPNGIFCGGWVGYFSYELGRYIEKLPETTVDDLQMPLIRLCFYDRLIAYDHLKNIFWLIAVELPADFEKPQDKFTFLESLMTQSQEAHVSLPASADLDNIDFSRFRCNMDKDYYLRMVEKIKRYIYDGDVYQINFSQRFECDYTTQPIDLFRWQNCYNPSPYSAYIDAQIGRILDALQSNGFEDDTIVLFTSDHGDMIGAHGFVYKIEDACYREMMEVPLLLRVPMLRGERFGMPLDHRDVGDLLYWVASGGHPKQWKPKDRSHRVSHLSLRGLEIARYQTPSFTVLWNVSPMRVCDKRAPGIEMYMGGASEFMQVAEQHPVL